MKTHVSSSYTNNLLLTLFLQEAARMIWNDLASYQTESL